MIGSRCLTWQGGTHEFCVASTGMMLALEQSRQSSVSTIYARIASGRWYINDVRETVRFGLIGGGMDPNDAIKAVQEHIDDAPIGLFYGAVLAASIMEGLFAGMPHDVVGSADVTPSPSKVTIFHEDGRLKRSIILALGAGLGWSPTVTYATSIWEITACIDGFNKANGADNVQPPTDDEFDKMLERHKVGTVQ